MLYGDALTSVTSHYITMKLTGRSINHS